MLFPRRRDGADTGAADTGLGPAALVAVAAADVEDVSGLFASADFVLLPPKREPAGLASSFLSSGFDSEGLVPNEKPVDFGASDCVLFVAAAGWVPNEKPVDLDELV